MKKCKCFLCRLILRINKIKPSSVKNDISFQKFRETNPRSDFNFFDEVKKHV